MGAKRIGYPLWYPEPLNGPPEHALEGISIGDLGFITFDGHFQYLFNIYSARTGINCDAPLDFEPLIPGRELGWAPYPCNHPGDSIISHQITPELADNDRWWYSYICSHALCV
jgi:hypothetical protein